MFNNFSNSRHYCQALFLSRSFSKRIMKDPAASSGVSSSVLRGHSGLDPESSVLCWTPAGVYPVLDTGPE